MGHDYAFQIVAARERLGAVLSETARLAVPEQREPLLRTASRVAAGEIRHLTEEAYHEVCLSMLFPTDPELERYGGNPTLNEPGLVALGCIYTRLWVGVRDGVITYTAATTGISNLFAQSPRVREAFRAVGAAAGAESVTLDREDGDLVQIWPGAAVVRGLFSYFALDDDADRVDAYTAALRGQTQLS